MCLLALFYSFVFFLMIRRPPRSTLDRSSAASDVYKRQALMGRNDYQGIFGQQNVEIMGGFKNRFEYDRSFLSLIHISEPTRPY